MKRTDFILDFSLALIKPQLSRRLTISTRWRLTIPIRLLIEEFINYKDIPEDQDPRDLMAENKMDKKDIDFVHWL